MPSGCAATAMPQSIRIYADAFGQDKEFFAFYRSMQAYRDALNGRTTSFVLSPDSSFFRFFENSGGTASNKAPPAPSSGFAMTARRSRSGR